MNKPCTVLLATVIASVLSGPTFAEELKMAKGNNYSLGNYTRCYQREFASCLRENREVGTGGYQVHYMCRQTATKNCSKHEKATKMQMYRG